MITTKFMIYDRKTNTTSVGLGDTVVSIEGEPPCTGAFDSSIHTENGITIGVLESLLYNPSEDKAVAKFSYPDSDTEVELPLTGLGQMYCHHAIIDVIDSLKAKADKPVWAYDREQQNVNMGKTTVGMAEQNGWAYTEISPGTLINGVVEPFVFDEEENKWLPVIGIITEDERYLDEIPYLPRTRWMVLFTEKSDMSFLDNRPSPYHYLHPITLEWYDRKVTKAKKDRMFLHIRDDFHTQLNMLVQQVVPEQHKLIFKLRAPAQDMEYDHSPYLQTLNGTRSIDVSFGFNDLLCNFDNSVVNDWNSHNTSSRYIGHIQNKEQRDQFFVQICIGVMDKFLAFINFHIDQNITTEGELFKFQDDMTTLWSNHVTKWRKDLDKLKESVEFRMMGY